MVKVVRGIKEAKEAILNIRKRQLESLNEQIFFTTVTKIINNVKDFGDQALINYTKDFDNVTLENILIPQKVLKDNWDNLDQKLKNSLMLASKRIREYHKISKPKEWYDKKNQYNYNIELSLQYLSEIGYEINRNVNSFIGIPLILSTLFIKDENFINF